MIQRINLVPNSRFIGLTILPTQYYENRFYSWNNTWYIRRTWLVVNKDLLSIFNPPSTTKWTFILNMINDTWDILGRYMDDILINYDTIYPSRTKQIIFILPWYTIHKTDLVGCYKPSSLPTWRHKYIFFPK